MADRHLVHICGPMERWDHIAHQYYGNAAAYGPIIAANRELFPVALAPVPQFLPEGAELQIPIIDTVPAPRPDQLPPWSR
ncbi:tail protein X [Bosea sp. TWI1241]|uniref:tail protein X n=1 Tax=Bosea sp. TWI1241 TaxID=3148904 RepID=UPI00320A9D31